MKDKTYLKLIPKRSLGQNFLIDDNISRKIIRKMSISEKDVIIEIGSGYGALTKLIVGKVRYLVAFELDKRLVAELNKNFQSDSAEIVPQNFLNVSLHKWKRQFETKLRIIGNIPYHLTSPILFKLFEERKVIKDITIMVQREVAQRIIARPHTKDYGILSVFSQFYGNVKLLFDVSPTCFYPVPKVVSTVIRITMHEKPRFLVNDQLFRVVVKTVFGKRRKTLRNSLQYLPTDKEKIDFIIKNINYSLEKRPEQLTIEELVNLTNEVGKYLDT